MKTKLLHLGLFLVSISLLSCQVDPIFDKEDYIKLGSPTSVVIPTGTIRIDDYTFENSSLETIVIPNTVDEIGCFCFASSKLRNITIPKSVKHIGGGAFCDTNDLDSIKIEGDTFLYDNGILYKSFTKEIISVSSNLTDTLILPSQISIIGEYAFYKSNLNTVILPDTLYRISDHAFDSSNLVSISIPAAIEHLDRFVFANCKKLENVEFKPAIWVKSSTFRNCTALEEISRPNIYGLHGLVFKDCRNLKVVRLGSSRFESYNNFEGCSKLEKVYIHQTLLDPKDWNSEEAMIKSLHKRNNGSPFKQ